MSRVRAPSATPRNSPCLWKTRTGAISISKARIAGYALNYALTPEIRSSGVPGRAGPGDAPTIRPTHPEEHHATPPPHRHLLPPRRCPVMGCRHASLSSGEAALTRIILRLTDDIDLLDGRQQEELVEWLSAVADATRNAEQAGLQMIKRYGNPTYLKFFSRSNVLQISRAPNDARATTAWSYEPANHATPTCPPSTDSLTQRSLSVAATFAGPTGR